MDLSALQLFLNAIEELKNSGLVISKKDNERIFLLK